MVAEGMCQGTRRNERGDVDQTMLNTIGDCRPRKDIGFSIHLQRESLKVC